MKHIKLILIPLLFVAICTNAQDSKITTANLDSLNLYFQKALVDWEVPGMSIAIVKDDKIIFAKGYGVLDIDTKKKVDANTMFAVASNTKTFTATAIVMLQEQGKLELNDPVTDHLSYFQLYDPYVTNQMKIRDLLCHRTGLVTFSGDLLWYGTTYSREEVIRRARFLEPKYGFRERFGYSNIMFMAAGEVIEEVTGSSWDSFIKTSFLEPLHMDRTITTTNEIINFSNVASPHTTSEDITITIPWLNWDNMAPAGSIISSANDMAQWIRLHLNSGSYNGDTLFSPEVNWQMWQSQTPLGVSKGAARLWPSTHFKSYGLGWTMFDYQGQKIVGHNGGYDGMISQMILIPEKNIGFVILTNKNSSLYYPLMYRILDEFLTGSSDHDWSKLFLDFQKRRESAKKDKESDDDIIDESDNKPCLPLEDYTGVFSCKMYGDVIITKNEQDELLLEMVPAPLFTGKLRFLNLNTFIVKLDNFPSLPEGKINYIIDQDGKVREMEIDIPNPDFDFLELKLVKK